MVGRVLLGVNIDHVATVREARYRGARGLGGEPDPVFAAHEAELGGADIITVHLREDRRHIQDRDLERLIESVRVRLNLEMGATDEMCRIATERRVAMVTLVPEGRQEVTTEGGLDVAREPGRMRDVVAALRAGGVRTVSAFIDADSRQVDAAQRAGFDACELHTGPYAEAFLATGGAPERGPGREALDRLLDAGRRVCAGGMRLHAGHALSYTNVESVASIPGMRELHIGHAIVARAVWVGLRAAVAQMAALIRATLDA